MADCTTIPLLKDIKPTPTYNEWIHFVSAAASLASSTRWLLEVSSTLTYISLISASYDRISLSPLFLDGEWGVDYSDVNNSDQIPFGTLFGGFRYSKVYNFDYVIPKQRMFFFK